MANDLNDVELVRRSLLMDEGWYRDQYRDVAQLGMSPAQHYANLGWRLGRDPGPAFSTRQYLAQNCSIIPPGRNPLAFYEEAKAARSSLPGPAAAKAKPAVALAPPRQARKAENTAIFACHFKGKSVPEHTLLYLRRLREVARHIVVVADHEVDAASTRAIEKLADRTVFAQHAGYDFGSFKIGLKTAEEAGMLVDATHLVLCNDSCVGPVKSFAPLFAEMDYWDLDAWGISANHQIHPHLQSYFLCISENVFRHQEFRDFVAGIEPQSNLKDVIVKFEIGLSKLFEKLDARFAPSCRIVPDVTEIREKKSRMAINHPVRMLDAGSPLIKTKALRHAQYNIDGIGETLARIEEEDPELYECILADEQMGRFADADKIKVSLIMPVFNREKTLARSIDSVIRQNHRNWELIVVDDGSSDASREIVEHYHDDPRIRLIPLSENQGVSSARNRGLDEVTGDLVAFVDSDNVIRPSFCSVFVGASIEHPKAQAFYAQFCRKSDGMVIGRSFDYDLLVNSNFIDLGVICHRAGAEKDFGGFDTSLRRLVDWDYILNVCKSKKPVFIDRVLMEYADHDDDQNRISIRENLPKAFARVRAKHTGLPIVTTAIVAYNQKQYIGQAIESALMQSGEFIHEILIADDGSNDGTAEVVKDYALRNPTKIRLIGDGTNVGISDNFRRCFDSASGDVIAILEGDDVWRQGNIDAKARFMHENPDASMVFSRLGMFSKDPGSVNFLERQTSLGKSRLTGDDFAADPDLNLIVNFSSCMFKTALMRQIPEELFDYRLSEICLAFYLEKHGNIGYIDEHLTSYRVHEAGVWSGLSKPDKLRSARRIRELTLKIAREDLHAAIRQNIVEKYDKPLLDMGEPLQ